MGKIFKINVLSIQLKKEMQALASITPILAMMILYSSFEAFVQGFQAMNSQAPETQKVNLIIAPTGSGKTTQFIARMVAKDPTVLIVLCLPRVLACNVAYYLRSEYSLRVCVKNGKRKGILTADTQVLIMTYRSAVNMVASNKQPHSRQISMIFDECHESCAEAVLLYKLMGSLFVKKPVWLHSLFCVSATMDPIELSTRLGVEQQFIQASTIEAPQKTFQIGRKETIPISVEDETTKKEKHVDEQSQPQPKPEDSHEQGLIRKYLQKFTQLICKHIFKVPKKLNESSVVIVDGINTANFIIKTLQEKFKKDKVLNVRFWNTFVQQECPVQDLSSCHLIIVGSHMKLSSSITFPRCTRLYVSDIMQVASQALKNATIQLLRGLVPFSVLLQCFGRGNRDVSTEVFYFPMKFSKKFEETRLQYPKQDRVSKFLLDFVEISVKRIPSETRQFCEKYELTIKEAESIFFSQVPTELLLALHSYSKSRVHKKDKVMFEKSLHILRALAHTVAYFSDEEHRITKPADLSHVPNGNFSQIVGKYVLHILNKVCESPTEELDSMWQEAVGILPERQSAIVSEIRESLSNDGLGSLEFSISAEINPKVVRDSVIFASTNNKDILPFFVKHESNVIFSRDDVSEEDTDNAFDKDEIDELVLLPFGTLLSAGGDYLFPSFFMKYGVSSSAKPQSQQLPRASACSEKPQSQQQPCACGGSEKPQSQQRPRASGGSAKPQSHQQPCARGSAKEQSHQQSCAGGGSAKEKSRQQPCAHGGSEQQQSHQQPCAHGGSEQQQSHQQPCAHGSAKSHYRKK
jgi:hypothetical protein